MIGCMVQRQMAVTFGLFLWTRWTLAMAVFINIVFSVIITSARSCYDLSCLLVRMFIRYPAQGCTCWKAAGKWAGGRHVCPMSTFSSDHHNDNHYYYFLFHHYFFIANLLPSVSVKEFWKLVNILMKLWEKTWWPNFWPACTVHDKQRNYLKHTLFNFIYNLLVLHATK